MLFYQLNLKKGITVFIKMLKKIISCILCFFVFHGNFFGYGQESISDDVTVDEENNVVLTEEEEFFYRVLGFKAPFKYSIVSERFNALSVKDKENGTDIPSEADTQEESLSASDQNISEENPHRAVILVKDYHCYYPAQVNIAATLNFLSANMPFVRSFLFEGAVGEIDLSVFQAFNDYNIRKDIAAFLMRKGFISAVENIAIANLGVDFLLYGLENLNVYKQHVESFLSFMSDFDVLDSYIKNIDSISRYLQYSLFSESAIKFLEKKEEYYSFRSVGLSEYAIYLRNKAVNFKIDYKQFSNFSIYMELLKYDTIINYIKIRAATDQIISDLQAVISKDDFSQVMTGNLKYNQGIISEKDYYGLIRKLMELYKVKLSSSHILSHYFTYLDIKETIDFDILREEIVALEHFILKELLKGDLQDLLFKMISEYELFKKFLSFEALPGDVGKVKNAVLDFFQFNITFKSLFFSIFKSNKVSDIKFDAQYLQNKMKSAEEFYDLAKARNDYILYNIIEFMNNHQDNHPLVFLGEFHLRSIADMLKNKNISYIIIEPKIEARNNDLYLQRMKGVMPLDLFYSDNDDIVFNGDINLAPYIYLSDYSYTEKTGNRFRKELFYMYVVLRVLRSLDVYKHRALMGDFTIDNPEFYKMINDNIKQVLTSYLSGKSISERVKMDGLFESLIVKPDSCYVSQEAINFEIGNTKVFLAKAVGIKEQKYILYNDFMIKKITNLDKQNS